MPGEPATVGHVAYWYSRHSRRMATDESWPNWPHYLRTSARVRELWQRPNPVARELLGELTGVPFQEDPAAYAALAVLIRAVLGPP